MWPKNHTFETSEIPLHSECYFQYSLGLSVAVYEPYFSKWAIFPALLGPAALAEGAAPAASSGSGFSHLVPKYPYCRASMGCAELHTSFASWLCQTGEACLFCWEFLHELENFRREVSCFQINYASGHSALLESGLYLRKR